MSNTDSLVGLHKRNLLLSDSKLGTNEDNSH